MKRHAIGAFVLYVQNQIKQIFTRIDVFSFRPTSKPNLPSQLEICNITPLSSTPIRFIVNLNSGCDGCTTPILKILS